MIEGSPQVFISYHRADLGVADVSGLGDHRQIGRRHGLAVRSTREERTRDRDSNRDERQSCSRSVAIPRDGRRASFEPRD